MHVKEMFLCVAIAVSLAICTATPVDFKDCGSQEGTISSLDVTPCENEPCVFHKGTTVKATVTFTPKEVVTNSTVKIHGIIGGLPVPFPVDNPDGCKDQGLTCPLKAGVKVTLQLSLDVKEAYPTLKNLVVKLELSDQNGKDVVCLEFPASIS